MKRAVACDTRQYVSRKYFWRNRFSSLFFVLCVCLFVHLNFYSGISTVKTIWGKHELFEWTKSCTSCRGISYPGCQRLFLRGFRLQLMFGLRCSASGRFRPTLERKKTSGTQGRYILVKEGEQKKVLSFKVGKKFERCSLAVFILSAKTSVKQIGNTSLVKSTKWKWLS